MFAAILNGCKKDEITTTKKKDPIITWNSPVDITLPTALSTIQLNAKADIPGTFTYIPSIGTVLCIGAAQNLKVDFAPTDSVNYNVATKTVIINVKGSGTVTDSDGNVYNTVVIGTQTWMVENLKTTRYNDNTVIAYPGMDDWAWQNDTSGAYAWYNNFEINEASYKATYGALYNWYAVNTGKLCPIGWHVPTDAEWKTLEMYLGMSQATADLKGDRGTNEGSKLAGNASLWANMGLVINTAFGTSGFTALPGGFRWEFGGFGEVRTNGFWWSSTEYGATYAWSRVLDAGLIFARRDWFSKSSGFSVRCLKD
jgi:uncharacterized protein (TIGR02145 family)